MVIGHKDQCGAPLTIPPHSLSYANHTEGTPYAGGYFKVKFSFSSEFPAAPPKCWSDFRVFVQTRLNFRLRLVRHKDLPPKRLLGGRDLRQHFKEGLAVIFWDRPHTCDREVFVDLPEP